MRTLIQVVRLLCSLSLPGGFRPLRSVLGPIDIIDFVFAGYGNDKTQKCNADSDDLCESAVDAAEVVDARPPKKKGMPAIASKTDDASCWIYSARAGWDVAT